MMWLMKRTPYFGLTLMASYAANQMTPDIHPYAFTASAFGILLGIFGLVGGEESESSVVKGLIETLLDCVPLAMMNIEIFSSVGNPCAMVHALFVIPLLLDVIAKLFGSEEDEAATQTLKHVSNLANVSSLLYLSYMEDNYMFGYVALSYLSAHAGMVIGGPCHGYLVDLSYIMSYTSFYFTSILAITNRISCQSNMLGTILDTVCNSLLMGSTGYAMFMINPKDHPFAFTACAVGFCHVCVGMCLPLFENNECLQRAKRLTTSCMEIITVPMINIAFYRSSHRNNDLALGHGLFIIPLIFDISFQLYNVEDDESTAVLKDLTTLGNIVSLLFFSVNESNVAAGVMAFSGFFANHGAALMESLFQGSGENCAKLGYAIFFALLPSTITDVGANVSVS